MQVQVQEINYVFVMEAIRGGRSAQALGAHLHVSPTYPF